MMKLSHESMPYRQSCSSVRHSKSYHQRATLGGQQSACIVFISHAKLMFRWLHVLIKDQEGPLCFLITHIPNFC
uniref:Uncharacterized protein n=1 Tax=Rhizophora mucronata TaxID=61149 RepID=A0A2P2N1P8_RHIMU